MTTAWRRIAERDLEGRPLGEGSVATGWMIDGLQATLLLWTWAALVLAYGSWRSFFRADPDPLRDSGPTF